MCIIGVFRFYTDSKTMFSNFIIFLHEERIFLKDIWLLNPEIQKYAMIPCNHFTTPFVTPALKNLCLEKRHFDIVSKAHTIWFSHKVGQRIASWNLAPSLDPVLRNLPSRKFKVPPTHPSVCPHCFCFNCKLSKAAHISIIYQSYKFYFAKICWKFYFIKIYFA